MKEHCWISSRGQRISTMIHDPGQAAVGTPILVVCHGFTGDKVGTNQMNLHLAVSLEKAGYIVVRFDHIGSGDSEGLFETDTSVAGWLEDLQNLLIWIREQKRFATHPIWLYGHSLGGLVVLLYDDRARSVSGRIVFAPVVDPVGNVRTSILGPELWKKAANGETIANFYGKAFTIGPQFVKDLMESRYDPIGAAAKLETPIFIIHGNADAAVPLEGSWELYDHYNGPKDFKILDVDHVASGQHGPWIQAVRECLDHTVSRA